MYAIVWRRHSAVFVPQGDAVSGRSAGVGAACWSLEAGGAAGLLAAPLCDKETVPMPTVCLLARELTAFASLLLD